MSKTLAGVIIALVALGAIGGIYIANKPDKADNSQQTGRSADSMDMSEMATDQQPVQSSDQVQSGTVEMDIANSAYAKPDITVKKGTTVVWTNQDFIQHDVTPDEESESFRGSELLSKGQSYSFRFNTVGTFTYHCTPHPFMKGTVTVVE